jgi:sec-independent protein translocase protein TatB
LFRGDCRLSFSGSIMKRMSFSETIFLFFLALIIFGPKKLPEIARMVGKYMNEFKRASNEFKAQIEQEIAHLEVEERKRTILPPSVPQGTASRTLNPAAGEASQAIPTPADGGATEAKPAEAPAIAASADEPLFAATAETPAVAAGASVATEAVPAATAQESHA